VSAPSAAPVAGALSPTTPVVDPTAPVVAGAGSAVAGDAAHADPETTATALTSETPADTAQAEPIAEPTAAPPPDAHGVPAAVRLWRSAVRLCGRPWPRAALHGSAIWLAAHLGYAAVMLLLSMINDTHPVLLEQWQSWKHWDTDWFVDITRSGYTGLPADRADPATAFFPLFPLLAWLVNPIVPGGPYAAVVVVSNVAFLAAVILLQRFFEEETDAATGLRGSWYLVIFPSGFFLAAGYNVSLAIALSVGCLYALRRQHWWLAAACGALASANRSSGVLLLIPFGYEYLRVRGFRLRKIRPDLLWAALVPAGLVAYMIYTGVALGDPLRFEHAQDNWKRTLAWPWVALRQSGGMVLRHVHNLNAFQIHNLLDLLSVAFCAALLVLALVGPWRLRRDQWALPLYGFAVLTLVTIFPDFTSAHPSPLRSAVRLVLEVFPAYLVLAKMGRNAGIDKVYTYLALVSQGLLLTVFLSGNWVA
jgi:Mannosyltransferase (PIG-V)